MSSTIDETATAAASGASATERFHTDKSPYDAVRDVPAERVDMLARSVLEAVHATVREHKVTYDEFNALKAWMIDVGEDGEWPLFLDVWVEHVVEEVNTEHREGNKGAIEGPYYVPHAPEHGATGAVSMREGEGGTPLTWTGQVTSTDGTALAGAKVELWHADSDGLYSQFAPGIPEWNLRGTFTTGDDGTFEIHTVQPAPYQIPTDGSCGKLIAAAGWHAWRPAPARQGVRARARAADRAALLPGRRAQRRRHRLGSQARAHPRPADPRRRHREHRLRLRPRPREEGLMLFHVRMVVRIPLDMDPEVKADLVAREKAYAQEVQESGRWPHLWRVVGEYANVSIFDVESNDALHDLLSGLPLFPYMDITVTPLAKHPSDIDA